MKVDWYNLKPPYDSAVTIYDKYRDRLVVKDKNGKELINILVYDPKISAQAMYDVYQNILKLIRDTEPALSSYPIGLTNNTPLVDHYKPITSSMLMTPTGAFMSKDKLINKNKLNE